MFAITFFLLLSTVHALSQKRHLPLEVSFDSGKTWRSLTNPQQPVPMAALLRVIGTDVPVVEVPSCALSSTLNVSLWYDDQSSKPFAISWDSAACDDNGSPPNDKFKISTNVRRMKRVNPEWAQFVVKETSQEDGDDKTESTNQKARGFFAKYGLYIMAFVGFALGHGIRKGLLELHEEAREEEAIKIAQTRSRSTQQVNIVAPRNRSTARSRKKHSKSSVK